MKRRLAELPLHTGKAPPWLFSRMWRLAGAVTMAIVDTYGPDEVLRRLADPWWFQAFGCVLGFDWHSSGLTTVTCGAMKEAYKHFGDDLGVHVAGGKGATSRKTPREIADAANRLAVTGGEELIFASKMSAKVDSAGLQDGYDLYHHCFLFTPAGQWCVVQQGMNERTRYARRYHWLGDFTKDADGFVCEPHNAIQDLSRPGHLNECARVHAHATAKLPGGQPLNTTSCCGNAHGHLPAADAGGQLLLNMVASEAGANRHAAAELIGWNPDKLMYEARRLTEGPTLFAPAHHAVLPADINLDRLTKIVRAAHEQHPTDFAALLGTQGVGAATVRSLSLLAELIYDAPASHRDPAREPPAALAPGTRCGERRWVDYSYAHGGKDGTPFPVDRDTYDKSIEVLTDAVRKARVGDTEKAEAFKRLASHVNATKSGR